MNIWIFNWGGVQTAIVARDRNRAHGHINRLRKVADVTDVRSMPLTVATDYKGPVVQGWIANARRYGSVFASGLCAVQWDC